MTRTSVTGIIIGNEVLTNKVDDTNGKLLISRLREEGVALRSLHVVGDEIDVIVETILVARRRGSQIITSGGIGPTHDDVTVRAVANALGRPVVELPELVERIQKSYEGQPSEAARRLALAPQGTRLISCPEAGFPVLACEGVFLLPGVPRFFKSHFEAVLKTFVGQKTVMRSVFLRLEEAEIAATLDAVAIAMPHVSIGSYPAVERSLPFRVQLTFEHTDLTQVDLAVERFLAAAPADCVVAPR
jgi:molybdenum cofactor synthesis domain-containing protein